MKNLDCIDYSPDESEEYGWIPKVAYNNAKSKDHCSNQTILNGYYSWSEALQKCGILNDFGRKQPFCKLSGSDFIAYSREEEYKAKDCKPVKGLSFILLRFLP